jgi:hypothetical protein
MNVGKWGVGLVAIAAIAALGQVAQAAEGRPSQDVLEQMGLGGIVMMSDDEGMAVRGLGFKGGHSSVRVFGNSTATINTKNGTAHSENGYVAEGRHFAAGANGSVAGVIHISKGGKKGGHPGGNMGGYGGNMGGWKGDKMRGGMNGHGKGGTKVRATIVFAGGFSFGVAH